MRRIWIFTLALGIVASCMFIATHESDAMHAIGIAQAYSGKHTTHHKNKTDTTQDKMADAAKNSADTGSPTAAKTQTVTSTASTATAATAASKSDGGTTGTAPSVPASNPSSSFSRQWKADFSGNSTVEEAGKMADSTDGDWWLSSGAYFYRAGGIAKSVQGSLSSGDKWYKEYASNNPEDTDNGQHPQNIFRLVTKSKWKNLVQEVYFKDARDNLSGSSNRNASNGFLFFNRYQDQNNVYYTGLRVDGSAIVKKKTGGQYYTVASKKVLDGTYDASKNPNLLPQNTWVGLRSEVTDNSDGTVSIKLYMDKGKTGNWQLLLETKDDGKSFGGAALKGEGYAGIRTDFMDVQFSDYSVGEKA